MTNGHRCREVAGTTRKQAKDRLTRRLGEVRAGTFDCPRERIKELGPTFDEFADTFLKDYGSRCRSNHYKGNLVPLRATFGESYLREITREDLDQFAADRGRAVGPSTLRKNLTVLSKVFRMGVRWGVLEASPAVDLEKPAEPTHKTRNLSGEERTRLLEHAEPWLRPMIRLALATGLRLGEVVTLTWENVDRKANVLHVSEDTKTGTRAVPLGAAALAVLDELVRHLRSPYVFAGPEGAGYLTTRARNRISQRTVAAARAAGIEDASFHTLRHTAASLMVRAGVPLYEVQRVLGHSTPVMTQRYSHLRPEDLRDAVKKLDAALVAVDTPVDTSTSTTATQVNAVPVSDVNAVA